MNGRKWTVRWMGGTLVLICAVGGALGQTPSKVAKAATVNGEIITVAELDAAVKRDGPMAVLPSEAQRKQQRQLALFALIDQTLMRQFLKQKAPPIDPKEVAAKMADLAAGLQKQNKTLSEFCRDLNLSETQVQEQIAVTLQWIAYARQHVSDKEVEKYYRENKDFFDKILVRASDIMLRVPAQGGDSAKAKAQARAQLTELRAKLVANQIDFAEAAKKYSQGPTKEQGGDLGFFPHLKGMMDESIMRAAFSLPPGQISEVIESEFGLHLIKVVERNPGQPSDFAKIKEDVRQLCIEDMQQNILGQLRKASKIEVHLP